MPKYSIPIYGTVSALVEVEADHYDMAVEKAIQNAPQTSFAIAKFDPVETWEADDSYQRDGVWIESYDSTFGE